MIRRLITCFAAASLVATSSFQAAPVFAQPQAAPQASCGQPVASSSTDTATQKLWTVRDYHGTAEGLARVIHEAFGVNVIMPAAAQTTAVRLSLANGTLNDFLGALAFQFSPPLDVQHDGDIYKLVPSTSVSTASTVIYLKHAPAQIVVDSLKATLQGTAMTTVNVVPGDANAITIVGTSASVNAAACIAAGLDQAPPPNSKADPGGPDLRCADDMTNGLPSCFIQLERLSADQAIYYLSKKFPGAIANTASPLYSVLPEPEQGGILITAASNVLRTAGAYLWQLDQQKKRQLTVTVYVYDVVPFNVTKSIGILYGSGNPNSSTGSSSTNGSTFTPGTFFRPSILSETSGIAAQINALDTIGTSKLVEAPFMKIALDAELPASANGAQAASTGQSNQGNSLGLNSLSGNTTVPTITGAAQEVPGAGTVVIGNTTIVPFQNNGLTNSFQVGQINSGITLTVKPIFVTSGGLMRLSISASFSNITSYVDGIPQLGGKSLQTEAYVRDGQSLSFGGLYADTNSHNDTKIPFLGDIPIFGHLFKNTDVTSSREQLVFFVVPEVQTL